MNSAVDNAGQKPVKVSASPPYRLHLILASQRELELDLTPLVTKKAVFWRLRNFRYFQKVSIDPLGGLCWPEGEDIAPERIGHYAVADLPLGMKVSS